MKVHLPLFPFLSVISLFFIFQDADAHDPLGYYEGKATDFVKGNELTDQAGVFIDPALENLTLSNYTPVEGVFHLFSHGKPGHLYIEGSWMDIMAIVTWFGENQLLASYDHLNIYGCEFARGIGGKMAVDYLEQQLGVTIAASNDTTGIDGDWELEVGTPRDVIQLPSYQGNLQDATNTANISGISGYYTYSEFSYDGSSYEGFCIEYYKDVPNVGDTFSPSPNISHLTSSEEAQVAAALDAMDDTSLGTKQERYTYISYAIWSITDGLNPSTTPYGTEVNLILTRISNGTYTAPANVNFGENLSSSSRQDMIFVPEVPDENDDPCEGNAESVYSSYYVSSSSNATGIPNSRTAAIRYSSSYLILDLGETVDPGEYYEILWTTYSSYYSASATVEESSDASSWTTASGAPFTVKNSSLVEEKIIASGSTRYVRIKKTGSGTLYVDAISYNTETTIVPYVRSNGGSWSQSSSVEFFEGQSFELGTQSGLQPGVVLTMPNNATDNSPDGNTYFQVSSSATASDAGTYTISYTDDEGCTTQQNYTASYGGTFPVEWLDFAVTQRGDNAIVEWSTATETNADFYGIERSIDGTLFVEVGQKKAIGNTTQISNYQYVDDGLGRVGTKVLFYRLKQVDLDGTFTYSKIVNVLLQNDKLEFWATVRPVPVRENMMVSYKLLNTKAAKLEVLSGLGQIMYEENIRDEAGESLIPATNWPSGLYYVRFIGESKKMVYKVQVAH